MDVEGAGTIIGLGSLCLTLEIEAERDGFKLDSTEFKKELIFWETKVKLTFTKSALSRRFSFSQNDILSRTTDRSIYSSRKVPEDFHHEIQLISKAYSNLKMAQFASADPRVLKPLKLLEKVRWSNEVLLQGMLSEIHFPGERRPSEDLISSDQLGITFFDIKLLSLVKKCKWLQKLIKIGFSEVPAHKASIPGLIFCDSLYFLQVDPFNFENCFNLGKCLQHIWLTASKQRISFQPIASPFIAFAHYLEKPSSSYSFSSANIKNLNLAWSLFLKDAELDIKTLTLGFRVGIGTKPSATGERKKMRVDY